ncbi:L-aspartate oxidase [Halovenus rubra]|uniref:L-aspartate oxidase n=2 Tax=Halovenus rubra TaxID=869890 RepID=A0ABD5X5U4_9EURY|nr:FAD-dependent oxidoreductase [Halovenus rubra]
MDKHENPTDQNSIRERETEILVLGSGIAGLAAAFAADRAGADVTLATKAQRPEEASTWWAQGGIAVARDNPDQFKQDIVEASSATADEDAVDVLVENATEAVRDVLVETIGIEFDTDGEAFDYTQEAAHEEPRILHINAETGKHIHVPFLNYVAEETGVEILEDTAALELLRHEGQVYGATLERDGDWEPTFAGSTILATGGIGALYPTSTNPDGATGDGIAMAALAGADVSNMEYVQFHPTACTTEDGTFLISEAVRGEGGLLRNGNDRRFMPEYHDDAELAPRDVVARAVKAEREKTGEVYLDVSPFDFVGHFPELAVKCEEHGIEWTSGIPVSPAQHFLCGGIDVDDRGQTTLTDLYAVGECACTGVHGANRLASTSLLEGLVWGLRAGEDAVGSSVARIEPPELLERDPDLPSNFARQKFNRLQRVMDEQVGIERSTGGLKRAQGILRRLKGEVDAYVRTRTSRSLYELRSASVVSLLVSRAAVENESSVGCHYLTDENDSQEQAPVESTPES